jgi:hypothetical protein
VHAAVNPEQVKVPDFHVDSLQIVGVIEPAQDVTAIEPALSDDLVDDVGKNETPKGRVLNRPTNSPELPRSGVRHE